MLVAEQGSWHEAALKLKKKNPESISLSGSNLDFSKARVLDQYVQFMYDQQEIQTRAMQWQDKSSSASSSYFLPIHHCLVRAMICILSDAHCPPHHLLNFLLKLQFFLDLVIKGATQYLCFTKRISMDRTAEIRFPKQFSDDITKLIRLISLQLNQICMVSQSEDQQSRDSTMERTGSMRIHDTATAAKACSLAQATQGKDLYALIGKDLAQITASFLMQLFNLMDRGFVLDRVRDLIVAVEIKQRMSVQEIDRCNELRCQMLKTLFEHEYFVQLNLPSLAITFQSG
ncbi:Dedicator of cytokinesis protein 10 [Cichlidogyrus casuarinus]|uniref:Dedicator of cytokinesis protein 10 n=1 Tax=Cichlidogyrus casuarinus TaxID=1844966 RepID=A0ABD2QHX7_9PLAT